MNGIDQHIKRIYCFLRKRKWTKNQISKETGLPNSTLRKIYRKEWNPRLSTLRKVESIVPEDFNPDDE